MIKVTNINKATDYPIDGSMNKARGIMELEGRSRAACTALALVLTGPKVCTGRADKEQYNGLL
jgi:hypothetical protein